MMPVSKIDHYTLFALDECDLGIVYDESQGTPHPDTGVIQYKTVFRGPIEQCREWISRAINHDRLSHAIDHKILDSIIADYLFDDHTGNKRSINDPIHRLLEWSNQRTRWNQRSFTTIRK